MDKLIEFITKHPGTVTLSYDTSQGQVNDWLVAVTFGQEDGSGMATGASYGIGSTLDEALAMVHEELKL